MARIHCRVLVIAESRLARAGLVSILRESGICEVAGAYAYTDLATFDDPDVILCDLGWTPPTPPVDFSQYDAPVVALIPDIDFARDANLTLMPAGVYGLLLRDSDPEIVVAAVVAVANGLIVIDPQVADTIMRDDPPPGDTLIEPLTPRESDVLQLLAQGLTNKAIAQQLNITTHTVKFHVNAIMGKLNAQSRTEAVILATRLGLVVL